MLHHRWSLLALLVTAIACLTLAAGAQAVTGDLTFDSCINPSGSNGCQTGPAAVLGNPTDIAVSPDGRSVFVVSFDSDSLARFSVGADGRLTFGGCDSSTGSGGLCTDLPGTILDGPTEVATSPSGSVYVGSRLASSLSHFKTPGGLLNFQKCFSNDGSGGACEDVPGTAFSGAGPLAVRKDGGAVYVGAYNSASVNHFRADPEGGDLDFMGCVSDTGAGGCVNVPGAGTPLSTPGSVAVSPDGSSVYVGNVGSGVVSHFTSQPNGQIAFGECVGSASAGCPNLPSADLGNIAALEVSPDGASVYAAAYTGDDLVRLSAGPTGQLSFASCLGFAPGCGTTPGVAGNAPLEGALGLAQSPDGSSIYVAGLNSAAVTHAKPGPGAALTFSDCDSDSGTAGACGDIPNAPLGAALAATVSPDGSSVYVAAQPGSVVRFTRELTDGTPPRLTVEIPKGQKAGKAVKVRVGCDEACSVSADGTVKPKQAKKGTLKGADADVAAAQTTTLKLKAKGKVKKALRRAGKAKATITLSATDAAGNTARTAALVKLK